MTKALFDVFTVRCFFGCGFVATGMTSEHAHVAMEKHYGRKHRREVDRIVGRDESSRDRGDS